MATQLTLPTLRTGVLGWLQDVPRWAIHGYRVHCGHYLGARRPFGHLVEWHTTRDAAAAALAVHRAVATWGYQYVTVVLRPAPEE